MAQVTLTKETSEKLRAALKSIKASSSVTADVEAILSEIRDNIETQLAAGRQHTNKSRKVLAAINKALDEDPGDMLTPIASIAQDHYTVTSDLSNAGPIAALVRGMAGRLREYVETEDATAQFTIAFKGGASRNSASRRGYTIEVLCTDTATADQIFKLIAPHVVDIYDEMDSDYDEDVYSFLVEI